MMQGCPLVGTRIEGQLPGVAFTIEFIESLMRVFIKFKRIFGHLYEGKHNEI